MPGGDRTGPLGLGPGTGWGMGYCYDYPVPGYANPAGGRWFGSGRGWGRGMGWGRGGFGRGRGFWRGGAYPYAYSPYTSYEYPYSSDPYRPNITPKQEADMLREEAKDMQGEIKSINERIAELESEAKSKDKSR